MKCQCHPDTPFHWKHNPRPSIFQSDPYFRTSLSQRRSQIASEAIQQGRAQGKERAAKGVSKNREAEILRMRTFSTFMLAKS
jgi:hypothetical protein